VEKKVGWCEGPRARRLAVEVPEPVGAFSTTCRMPRPSNSMTEQEPESDSDGRISKLKTQCSASSSDRNCSRTASSVSSGQSLDAGAEMHPTQASTSDCSADENRRACFCESLRSMTNNKSGTVSDRRSQCRTSALKSSETNRRVTRTWVRSMFQRLRARCWRRPASPSWSNAPAELLAPRFRARDVGGRLLTRDLHTAAPLQAGVEVMSSAAEERVWSPQTRLKYVGLASCAAMIWDGVWSRWDGECESVWGACVKPSGLGLKATWPRCLGFPAHGRCDHQSQAPSWCTR